MIDPYFEYLTGTVRIPAIAPADWQANGLEDFYRTPDDDVWGAALSRPLCHASIRFWHVFSSGYMANLVADDWRRLEHFRDTGEVLPVSSRTLHYESRAEGLPFSPRELLECWTRFWDLHMRGPAAVVRDEGYPADEIREFRFNDALTGCLQYTHEVFDYLMLEGPSTNRFKQPYRWLLDQAHGASAFVSITFPILVHAAFGSPDPVRVFTESFDRTWNSDRVLRAVAHRTGNLNVDWLDQWGSVVEQACVPVLQHHRMPGFTSGREVIERGPLSSHPMYGEYVDQFEVLDLSMDLLRQHYAAGPVAWGVTEVDMFAIADSPSHDPWIVFGLPGQPDYRYRLGMAFPPFQVQFENFTLNAQRPLTRRMLDLTSGKDVEETYSTVLGDLASLVERFRQAEYAVSVGLPPDVFERSEDRSLN